ncbi:DUF3667 domain-containing protein [Marilutibacter chinensis]|uniref:DUF3667 domain-containing protein n=1 Tax=Marilutibacter chinensis TaxID=2912247 RepID=A0ABS9HTU5_9GAMM|nr:DUF3667 domain-containing protein [Lysobacter chinensis]MCF7221582.1 DUF3667 domain-containing protein [Lysobacter chinensis]
MTEQTAGVLADAVPPPAEHGRCENCGTPLQGHYCHACGQSMHSPVRHVGHAIEEVFESFWHLDGRVFRTLRDLLVPGRTAIEYLAGHRVRYIAPLRMFVILSLLTFFLGKLMVHFDVEMRTEAADIDAITRAGSVEEVERERDRLLQELAEGRREIAQNAPIPGLDAVMIKEEIRIRGEADNRIAQLRRRTAAGGTTATEPVDGSTDAPPSSATAGVEPSPGDAAVQPEWEGPLFTSDSEAWDPEKHPVRIGWLPQFANDWLNRRLGYARANVERIGSRPELWFQAFMTSLPSALFLLVPVFALLLKVAYLFKRRLYLEHLTIALYSHCFLLIALTVIFLLIGLGEATATALPWLSWLTGTAILAICMWMPLYLLLMQKRVYRQGWAMTLLKYLVIGYVYFFMLALAASLMFIATLAKPI